MRNRKPELGILKLTEKHGEQYFDCSTEEKLYDICFKIVQARHKTGYWYYFDKPEEPPVMQEPENLDKLPDYLKLAYDETVKDYEKLWRHYNNEIWTYNDYQLALTSGVDAYHFLLSRNDYEYEGFEIIPLQEEYYL